MPSMRHNPPPSRGCYGRLMRLRPHVQTQDDEDDELLDTQPPDPLQTADDSVQFTNLAAVSEIPSTCTSRKEKVKASLNKIGIVLLTNVIASVIIIISTTSISVGLCVYVFRNGTLQIDKTVKSFTIPNHIASRRQDALEVAIKDLHKSSYIGKRDLRHQLESTESHEIDMKSENLPRNIHSRDDNTFEVYIDPKLSKTSQIHRISKRELKEKLKQKIISEEFRYMEAENRHRNKRMIKDDHGRINGITQAFRRWKMQLVYLAVGEDENMFTAERLETVRRIERAVMDHKNFMNFCYIHYGKWKFDPNLDRYRGCSPLNSLLTYFYPSQTDDGMVHFDGLGTRVDDINKTLSLAMTHDSFFWFVDDKISNTNRRSRILRSEVHFGAPLPYFDSYGDKKEEQHDRYIDFVITYIDLLSKLSTDKVRVLYGGNELFDYEVDKTFWNDVRLAFFTLAFIVVFMFVLTSFSIWLTLCGILSILLSFPLALFFYHVVFSVESLGILNGAAAFVIIGIGVDDVFVFINTFRQSHAILDHKARMIHTVRTATVATFFTSFTTAAAFAANVASSIPAVHDFGLFMSLIVSGCWITVVLVMPPTINIWARAFAKCESRCYSPCIRCKTKSPLTLPEDMNDFLLNTTNSSENSSSGVSSYTSLPSSSSSQQVTMTTEDKDDDAPLLRIEDIGNHEGGWPIYLGMLNQMLLEDDDPLLSLEGELTQELLDEGSTGKPGLQEGCSLTAVLQAGLYTYVAKPVVKIRWFILGGYLVLLAVSIGLMTQLTPATKPPQLFNSDSNLQMLMDLAANFSDDSITCDDCSAFFKETSIKPIPPTAAQQVTPGRTEEPATNTPDLESSTKKWTRPGTAAPDNSAVPVPQPTATPAGKTQTSASKSTSTVPPGVKTAAASSPTQTDIPTALPSSSPNQPAGQPRPFRPLTTPQPAPTPGPAVTLRTPPAWMPPATDPSSVGGTYDPCANNRCKDIKARPNLEMGAVIYVVFGILDIDRSNVSYKHVLTDKGQVIYDEKFQENFLANPAQAIADMCRVCKAIANNTKLVRPNSSQCMPQYGLPQVYREFLEQIPQCRNLPKPTTVNGRYLPARAIAGRHADGHLAWLAMAFESTTFKGQSYFSAYSEYQRWEEFIENIKTTILDKNSPLQSVYQTSDFWESVMMEIVAVSSATYGLVLSMVICTAAVAVFTAHIQLLVIVLLTIVGVICVVVGLFFLAGWEMGAVEAVSLSILVGSSVDYCVHLVEGYLLAGRNIPPNIAQDEKECRRWRALAAVSHIGVSITSSAITTIVAAIPLCLTVIQPFSKFGQIVTINTSISIVYTLTCCVAFLSIMGPAKFRATWRVYLIAALCTSIAIGLLVLILYIIAKAGVNIPAPNGQNLFR